VRSRRTDRVMHTWTRAAAVISHRSATNRPQRRTAGCVHQSTGRRTSCNKKWSMPVLARAQCAAISSICTQSYAALRPSQGIAGMSVWPLQAIARSGSACVLLSVTPLRAKNALTIADRSFGRSRSAHEQCRHAWATVSALLIGRAGGR
jgi:hypothetical protein